MNEQDNERLREMLKSTIAPLEDSELKRDLWPRMLQRLDDRPIRTSWWDWALVAVVMVWFFVFPEVIPALLYQL